MVRIYQSFDFSRFAFIFSQLFSLSLSLSLPLSLSLSVFRLISSSCRAISTYTSGPLSRPPLAIVHCFRQVFRATPPIGTELTYVGSSWSSRLCSSIRRGPQEYTTYEIVLTSTAVSRMAGLSNFDHFRDRWKVAVQLLVYGVLPPGLVHYCPQHSCVVANKLFLHTFSKRPCSASI